MQLHFAFVGISENINPFFEHNKNATFDFEMLHFYYQIIYRSVQKKLNPNLDFF